MRKAISVAFTLCAIMFLVTSCKKTDKGPQASAPVFSTRVPSSPEDTLKYREIYYGLMTPVEVCNIFERLGLSYREAVISPAENRDLYMSSYKAAMNLGVYGVDMGYMKLFGVNRQTVSYFNTLKTLSDRLNIPDTFLSDAIRSVDRTINNADSLTGLMNDAYAKIDSHLRQEGSEGTLGLMLMGGWVEAMYLATQLAYDPSNPDPQVVAKIAEQKYSLNSLLSFMKNYYDDPMVAHFTRKLRYLYRNFDAMEVWYSAGEVETDTAKGVIRARTTGSSANGENINAIRDYIRAFRAEITAV